MKIEIKATLLLVVILIVDQVVKIWIKTNMCLGQEYSLISNKIYIHFTENNGMAFGLEFFGNAGKLLLTSFRVVFIGFIGWYAFRLMKTKINRGLIYGLMVMLAGATGNLIDSLFYGLLFNASTYTSVAQIFPASGGYAPFMFGKVVDMFYCPVIDTILPQWFPVWGGENFIFFRPIFNIADSAITCSVIYLLIFQRKALSFLFEKAK